MLAQYEKCLVILDARYTRKSKVSKVIKNPKILKKKESQEGSKTYLSWKHIVSLYISKFKRT